MKRKSIIGLVLVLLAQVLSQALWIPAALADAGAGAAYGGQLTLNVYDPDIKRDINGDEVPKNFDGQIVLGKSATLDLRVENPSSSDWAYNVGIQLKLPDGLAIADDQAPAPSSAVVDDETQEQTVYWQDVKNLAPGESYDFPVKVKALDTYRSGSQVPFLTTINALQAQVYASNNARIVYKPTDGAPVQSVPQTVQIVPFTVKVIEDSKQVKGAGVDSSVPASGGHDWGEVQYQIVVNNNTRSASSPKLTLSADGVQELYGFSTAPSSQAVDTAGNKRTAVWNAFAVGIGEEKTIDFDSAFLNYAIAQSAPSSENTGAVVKDSTTVTNTVGYSATLPGGVPYTGQVAYQSTSKDIVIDKSVDKSTAKYGDELLYTLNIRTNEYENVTGVVVTDTIGDGQTFESYVSGPDAANPAPTKNDADGTTTLTWNLNASLTQKAKTVTIQYKVKVDPNWTHDYAAGPVYAGDILHNKAIVEGDTVSSGPVKDGDWVDVPIAVPGIGETIAKINGAAPSGSSSADEAYVTIGDKVTFDVTYTANLGVDQHNVTVIDYLPLGTALDGVTPGAEGDTLNAYGFDGVKRAGASSTVTVYPQYYPSQNMLVWELGDLDQSVAALTTSVTAVVQNDDANVQADKKAENLVNLSYTNSPGTIESKRDTVKLVYTEPKLALERKLTNVTDGTPTDADLLTIDGGDTVKVKLTLTNTGKTTAYDVMLMEPINDNWWDSAVPPSQGTGSDGTFHYDAGTKTITFDGIPPVAPGDSVDLIYTVQIANPIGAGRLINQGASWSFDSQPGGGRVYGSGDSAQQEASHVTMKAPVPIVTKKVVDSSNGGSDTVRNGDWVVYQITASIPAGYNGVYAYKGSLKDNIPTHQSYSDAYSAYDLPTHTGTPLGSEATHTSNSVTVTPTDLTITPGTNGSYTFYVKAVADSARPPGNQETNAAAAELTYYDQSAGGQQHTATTSGPVGATVQWPFLTAAISPKSANLAVNEEQAFTFTISNSSGKSTAYQFTPTIELQPGFEFTQIPAEFDQTSATKLTLKSATNLPSGNQLTYSFKVKLVEVQGSGSTFPVVGATGSNYANEAAAGADPGDTAPISTTKFQSVNDQATITVPSVSVTNVVAATSNGGNLTQIRPGDTVTYKIVTKIPAGTTAYNVKIEDTIGSNGQFDWVSGPAGAQWSGNTVSFVPGADVQTAQVEDTLYETEIVLRAKTDAPSWTNPYKTHAVVKWNTAPAAAGATNMSAAAPTDTSISIVQPSVTIGAQSLVSSVFDDDHRSITVGFKLTNAGPTAAYNAKVSVPIPDTLVVDAATITQGGRYDAAAKAVVWDGVQVDANGDSQPLAFDVSPSQTAGAGASGLQLTATLSQYASAPAPSGTDGWEVKTYNSASNATQFLSVAPLTLSANVLSTTYGGSTTTARPGDSITYRVHLHVPSGQQSSYDTVLLADDLFAGQSVKTVMLDGEVISYSEEAHGYELGTLTGDQDLTVTTTVDTDSVHADPYSVQYTPKLTYKSAPTDGTSNEVAASQLQVQVIEPNLSIQLTANDSTKLQSPGDKAGFTLTIRNNGSGPAYSTTGGLNASEGFAIGGVQAPEGVQTSVTSVTYGLGWEAAEIPPGGQLTITFEVTALSSTGVQETSPVQASVAGYYSLPGSQGKQYEPLHASDLNVEVFGHHSLATPGSVSAAAGQTVTFGHTLSNTGAGRDIYVLRLDSLFPTRVLKDDGTLIAEGLMDGASWTWTYVNPDYEANGEPAVALDAGGTAGLKLEVAIPETAPYGSTVYVTLGADAQLSGLSSEVQDRIAIVGDQLDGWSGSQPQGEGWRLPAYLPGDIVAVQAKTANNVESVKAFYESVEEDGAYNGQVGLLLANADTYVADGYKKWVGSIPLAPSAVAGNYQVRFEGYDANGALIASEIDPTTDAGKGANNPFAVRSTSVLQGTITDSVTGDPIEGAVVTLHDPSGASADRTATTDADGKYSFGTVEAKLYEIVMAKDGYAEARTQVFAVPSDDSGIIVVDQALSPFKLELSAAPTSILGDGQSRTTLTAKVTDADGHPVAGVTVTFASPTGKGTFPGPASAVTDENGVASVPFQSDLVTGTESQRIPVRVEVNDASRQLHAAAQIVLMFEPGAIAGVVTEMKDGTQTPVEGALIVVSNAALGFTASTRSAEDGSYNVAIPQGNTQYRVTITKPVQVAGVSKLVTFEQTATVGALPPLEYKKFYSDKAAGGLVAVQAPDGTSTPLPASMYNHMFGYLLDESGQEVLDSDGNRLEFPIRSDGSFNVSVPAGNYRLVIGMELSPTERILLNRKADGTYPQLRVTQTGEMNISTDLIDPYGIVTDSVTGKPIEGAHVELYYADTPRNVASGRTPNTLVILPELPGFAPNDNDNPQPSDAAGNFAYMVYGMADYYLVVSKPGYNTKRTPTISVEKDIVRYDVQLDPATSGGGSTNGQTSNGGENNTNQADLAVAIYSDRASYGEGDTITFTVKYANRSSATAEAAVLAAGIPANTELVGFPGDTVQSGQVKWNLGNLAPGATGQVTYQVKVKAGSLTQREVTVEVQAQIASGTQLIHPEDDSSKLAVLLFSTRFGEGEHERYIKGYPDGLFKPNRAITRAEIAAIFARIMDLKGTVDGSVKYNDVPAGQWAAGYIEAVTKAGLFTGYEGNKFLPDQPITRAELSTVIARYLKLSEGIAPLETHFSDLQGNWAADAIEEVYRYHIITGYEDGTFRPNAKMIRSEAVTMINRLLHRGPLLGGAASFPDVPASNWAFGQVEESTVTHEYDRNADGSEQLSKAINEDLW